MATAAQAFVPDFTQAQFPPDTVDQLVAATNALSAAMTDRQTARVTRVESTAELHEQLRRAREAVAMLDAIVTKELAVQPGLLAAWRSAKRITAAPTTSVGVPVLGGVAVPAVPAVPAGH